MDIPNDYKKAFEAGTLIPQIEKEFEQYDKLIKDMDEFIELNKNQWSSNDRLRLQYEHANSQLNDLKSKFNEFKQPILMAKRIEKLTNDFNEIECSIDDLTGVKVSEQRVGKFESR